jgi:hypothetical protein
MTYGEIYTDVCRHLWGNSTPPASASLMLQGEHGIIADAQQKVQRDYNYWFMQTYGLILTIDGQYRYYLPTDFKEIINCLFKQDGTTNFYKPLSPLGLGQSQFMWNENEAEYPEYYEIVDSSIVLYPKPSEARTLTLNYWQIFARPLLTTTEDAVSLNMPTALAYMSIVTYANIQKEYDIADRYDAKTFEEIELMKAQDRAKRQNHIGQVLYRGV